MAVADNHMSLSMAPGDESSYCVEGRRILGGPGSTLWGDSSSASLLDNCPLNCLW
jgi:hypothetical protein